MDNGKGGHSIARPGKFNILSSAKVTASPGNLFFLLRPLVLVSTLKDVVKHGRRG